jgi:hypothetical protein
MTMTKHAADEDISIGNKIGEKFGKMCVDACDRGLERPYEFHLEDEFGETAEIIVGDTYPDLIGDKPFERVVTKGPNSPLVLPVKISLRSKCRQKMTKTLQ